MGAYTGNAIASIACHEAVAVVDANVVRVVSRLRRLAGNPTTKESIQRQTALADALLRNVYAGDDANRGLAGAAADYVLR